MKQRMDFIFGLKTLLNAVRTAHCTPPALEVVRADGYAAPASLRDERSSKARGVLCEILDFHRPFERR